MLHSLHWKIKHAKEIKSNNKGCIEQHGNMRPWNSMDDIVKHNTNGHKKDKNGQDKACNAKLGNDPDPFIVRLAVSVIADGMLRILRIGA